MSEIETDKSNCSERELIERILAGAKQEFRLLVLANQDKIYAIILRQTNNESIARELTQESFLKAYLHLETFQYRSSFSTWLVRIALNTTNTYFSSKSYKQFLRTSELSQERQQSIPDNSKLDSYDPDATVRLRKLIANLRPKLREVIVLCGLEQKTYQEAAEILEIPIGTVRSRLSKARHEVRKRYFEE